MKFLAFGLSLIIAAWILSVAWGQPSDKVERNNDTDAADAPWPDDVVREAPLPAGFPPPYPAGKIVEKTYPAARTYWAKGTLNTAFMQCFLHLKQHKHEMTTPVVWDYRQREKPVPELLKPLTDDVLVERLHFILEEPTMDTPGKDGPVTVAEMPKMRVLSIAYQGDLTADVVADLEKKLRVQIDERDNLTADGDARILGYNSPMVPQAKRYWEVQIPVKAK